MQLLLQIYLKDQPQDGGTKDCQEQMKSRSQNHQPKKTAAVFVVVVVVV